jgi:hypothetical protein
MQSKSTSNEWQNGRGILHLPRAHKHTKNAVSNTHLAKYLSLCCPSPPVPLPSIPSPPASVDAASPCLPSICRQRRPVPVPFSHRWPRRWIRRGGESRSGIEVGAHDLLLPGRCRLLLPSRAASSSRPATSSTLTLMASGGASTCCCWSSSPTQQPWPATSSAGQGEPHRCQQHRIRRPKSM